MKKLCIGLLLASALLFAQKASAEPCGLCQAYYPCYWSCEHCTGMWTFDGYCMGEVYQGTCGDTGQCRGYLASTSSCDPVVDQSAQPLLAQILTASPAD